mmetsp:Transcript_4471/g.10492  ORF Transcript_4471/g.10492 Transcript_4471/m.10492 type:complete len:263 (-) Transcript_4471:517-1305(-)
MLFAQSVLLALQGLDTWLLRSDRLYCRRSAKALQHDVGHEIIDQFPSVLDLRGEGVAQAVPQREHQTFAHDRPVALLHPVVHMARPQLCQHGHQAVEVVEPSDSAAHDVDVLGEVLAEHRVLLLLLRRGASFTSILLPHFWREEVRKLWCQLESVPVQALANGVGAQGLQLFPTAFHRCPPLVAGQDCAETVPGGDAGRYPLRCGKPQQLRLPMRDMAQLCFRSVLPQPALQLYGMPAPDAKIPEVRVLYLEERLHVVEAAP